MIVECVANHGRALSPVTLSLGGHGDSSTEFPVAIGQTYVVAAMSSRLRTVITYCIDDPCLEIPSELFRVVDGRLSRHWIYGHTSFEEGQGRIAHLYLWGYPEYVESNDHRLALVDGKQSAIRIFKEYRERMVLEFAPPGLQPIAAQVGGGWLQCAACLDAWPTPEFQAEMARCPSCGKLQRRPQDSH
jgi:hypothetical protein